MAKEFTQINIPKELHEELKKYTDERCMKMSPFVEKLLIGSMRDEIFLSFGVNIIEPETKRKVEKIIKDCETDQVARITVHKNENGDMKLIVVPYVGGFQISLSSKKEDKIKEIVEIIEYWSKYMVVMKGRVYDDGKSYGSKDDVPEQMCMQKDEKIKELEKKIRDLEYTLENEYCRQQEVEI